MISFHYSYLLGLSTVHNIIKETCSVIWNELGPLVLPSEISKERWLQISKEFQDIWNFPNAIAALDGKHIRVQVIKILPFFCFLNQQSMKHEFFSRSQ